MSVKLGYSPNATIPIIHANTKAEGYESMKNRGEYETLLCERDVLGDKKRSVYERRGSAAKEDSGSTGVVGK
jgi:hypothetical protein